jgi:GMP synthase-like glutamine amidotransferase
MAGDGTGAGGLLVVQHAESEGPGLLQREIEKRPLVVRRVRPDLGEGVPRSAAGFSAVLILGGPMGVYEADRFPHLRDEIALAAEALRRGVPILGICLGAQILAAAAGTRVYRGPAQEIGWHATTLTPEGRSDPLLGKLPAEGMMFHWHGDTFDPPPGSALLASSRLYVQQAFRVPPRAWGVQFHPEITEAMVDEWAGRARDDEAAAFGGAAGAARMRSDASRYVPANADRVAALGHAFLSLSAV